VLTSILALLLGVGGPGQGNGEAQGRLDSRKWFGFSLGALADIDGDGIADILIGSPEAGVKTPGPGRVSIVSGKNGSLIYSVVGEKVGDWFGSCLAPIGDMDGDGIQDFIVGTVARSDRSDGYACVYSGKAGKLIFRCAPTPTKKEEKHGTGFGEAVAGLGDVDGDGVPDFAIGAPFGPPSAHSDEDAMGQVFVYSGKTGKVIFEIDGDGSSDAEVNVRGAKFGSTIVGLPDVDGDGVEDIAIAASGDVHKGSTLGVGCTQIYSSKSRRLLASWVGKELQGSLGCSMCRIKDVDKDGVDDLVAGSFDQFARLYSCKSLKPLWTAATLDPGRLIEGYGASVVSLGDMDGDGISDVGVGCFEGIGGNDYFCTILSGKDGHNLRTYDTDQDQVVVGRCGDVDGDGVPDMVLGFPERDEVDVVSGINASGVLHRSSWRVLYTVGPVR
jgi:hypothetical protein